MISSLKLLPYKQYRGVRREYSVIFYYLPIFAGMYRRRVELCLAECKGGSSILEVGFGSGLTFLNLNGLYQKIYGLDLSCDVKEVAQVFAPLGIYPELRNGNVLNMPYQDNQFDTVLLISILEHLQPKELERALQEIKRVLKPGGQVVYGVPVERPFMVAMFALLGYNIRKYHFSTEKDVAAASQKHFAQVRVIPMKSTPAFFGNVYEIGHFIKPADK
ncbi:MAG TPA: class I SAM-dependent methyltransferase [Anaerolineales bacterium]|jgi:demethylmenaquinone methyltransferase/2-methoxy-6-polyprenyl-1,4-benzoquinol methylase|nr:class I SAM-dependent methyltransferase [Anaerolineales bacterium]